MNWQTDCVWNVKGYLYSNILETDIFIHLMFRNGGGIGSGDIRKMAYFESSINPSFTRAEVCAKLFACNPWKQRPKESFFYFRKELNCKKKNFEQGMKINDGIKKLLIFYILTVRCMFSIQGRDKTQVIVYRCPGYTAVQVILLLLSMKTYLQHFISP